MHTINMVLPHIMVESSQTLPQILVQNSRRRKLRGRVRPIRMNEIAKVMTGKNSRTDDDILAIPSA